MCPIAWVLESEAVAALRARCAAVDCTTFAPLRRGLAAGAACLAARFFDVADALFPAGGDFFAAGLVRVAGERLFWVAEGKANPWTRQTCGSDQETPCRV